MNSIINKKVKHKSLGHIDFQVAWNRQESIFNGIIKTKIENRKTQDKVETENYLITCSHPHVYTLGKSGDENNLLIDESIIEKEKLDYYKINRGGDITYHGKGQLIGYPIIRLSDPKKVLPFVRSIENSIIDVLSKLNIDSYSKDGDTGVWTEKGKIASIGIKVSKWTTYHGFSLNISEELSGFNLINPCGNSNEEIAAVHQFNKEVSFKEIVEEVSDEFINSK